MREKLTTCAQQIDILPKPNVAMPPLQPNMVTRSKENRQGREITRCKAMKEEGKILIQLIRGGNSQEHRGIYGSNGLLNTASIVKAVPVKTKTSKNNMILA